MPSVRFGGPSLLYSDNDTTLMSSDSLTHHNAVTSLSDTPHHITATQCWWKCTQPRHHCAAHHTRGDRKHAVTTVTKACPLITISPTKPVNLPPQAMVITQSLSLSAMDTPSSTCHAHNSTEEHSTLHHTTPRTPHILFSNG